MSCAHTAAVICVPCANAAQGEHRTYRLDECSVGGRCEVSKGLRELALAARAGGQ